MEVYVAGNSYGIYVDSNTNNITIGGIGDGEGHFINGHARMTELNYWSSTTATTTADSRERASLTIAGLGIDLGGDGWHVNDAGDARYRRKQRCRTRPC